MSTTSPTTTLSSSSSSSSPSSLSLPRPATIGRDALYLVAGLPAGVVTFSVLVTGLATAAGLAVTLLGIPVLLATLIAARAMGDVERRRAGWVLADGAVRRTDRLWRGGLWSRFTASATDVGAWRDTVWGLILLPLGTFGFSVAVTLWSSAVGFITQPLWYWAVPDDSDTNNDALQFLSSHAAGPQAARVAAGLVLIPVAIFICRALADATARSARALLQH
ncbi:sensor domain-containing protein [Baekduia alba]|uniref:sensor domain-containing protein n=1 Tax=Baekduia alba TaxID=2997333 RepID=UPI00234180E6|nr:sensor domain-containing protein [Baekduia alba]